MPSLGKLATFLCLLFCTFLGCQQQQTQSSYSQGSQKFKPVSTTIKPRSVSQMAREVNVNVRMMPAGSRARRKAKRMRPSYITIHSTANHRPTATAMQHARALNNGAFKDRNWHFSTDQYMVVQHLPLNETAWHAGTADGNNNSIGIEMCESESRGNTHFRTWDRSAKLTALLMKRYRIPLRRVVPHHHWYGKNCPAPLMDNGRPGRKWRWFKSRVDYYYRCINNNVPFR